jgi:aryl-alcohol dehydrogenase-like predicted oxidoreductase
MNKRSLGNTGIKVSEVAFGGVEIGMPYGIGVESAKDMLTETAAIRLLHAAHDAGINFIDTARQYGASENIIGKAFKQKREQVVIATKCRHLRHADQSIPENLSQHIHDSLQESLAALQTNYADVFMLHDSDPDIIQHPQVPETFAALKRAGRIRATGVSTYTPAETAAAIKSGYWDVVQVPFNLLDQRQAALFATARQQGVGIVVRSVLLKGLLSSRGQNLHPALQGVETRIGDFKELAQQAQLDLPTLATRFALSFKEVSSILVGLDKMDYLQQCLQAANGDYLTGEQMQQVTAMAYPEPDFLNLHHWSVMGWLK